MALVFGILLLSNLFVVGCLQMAYAKTVKYENNMVLGITLSEEQYSDRDMQEQIEKYKKAFQKTIITGYITAVLVNLPMFWYMSIWLILYMIWMFGYIAMVEMVYVKYHKKMYDMKMQKGYTFGSNVYEVAVDTRLSQMKNKMPVSRLWFVFSLFPVLLPLAKGDFRKYLAENLDMCVMIYGLIFLVKAAYVFMYELYAKKKGQVYSKNSEINITCNQIVRRGYSIIFVVASFMDSVSFLLLLYDEITMGYMTLLSVVLFVILQMLIVSGIVYGMYTVKRKADEILQQDKEKYMVDEDEFWKNGFYYNPKDNRMFVQDRQFGINMTFNMAKKSSWIVTAGIFLATLILVGGSSLEVLRLDFVETTYEIGEKFYIHAPSYPKEIEFDEIKSVKLIEELPDVRMSKQVGAATDKYSLGKFHVRNQGSYYLYIYHGYSPIMELETEDMKIYLNSRQEGVIEECYQELLQKVENQ